MREREVIAEARFDPKLKSYWLLSGASLLALTIVGIPLLPFWLLLGPPWVRRRFESLSCRLTQRSLVVERGVVFRSEKTVPLDKIQDLSLKEGPLLRRLGLASLHVETAGQSAQGQAEAALVGLVDVHAFRDRVLTERDRLAERLEAPRQGAPEDPQAPDQTRRLLVEIRDCLHRIEGHLLEAEEQAPDRDRRH